MLFSSFIILQTNKLKSTIFLLESLYSRTFLFVARYFYISSALKDIVSEVLKRVKVAEGSHANLMQIVVPARK